MDFNFDEDLFGESTGRCNLVTEDYTAKNCEQMWFISDDVTSNEEPIQLHLYRGDTYYYKKDYDNALKYYLLAMQLLHANNLSLKRVIQDCVARCYTNLAQYKDAETIAVQLCEDSYYMEQKTAALNLLLSVYHAAGKVKEEQNILQQFITLQPTNPHLWLQLAETYSIESSTCVPGRSQELLETVTSNSDCEITVLSDPDSQIEKDAATELLNVTSVVDTVRRYTTLLCKWASECNGYQSLQVISCLTAARILLSSVEHSVVSFAKERNQRLEKEIHERILSMNISDKVFEVLRQLTKYIIYRCEDEGFTDGNQIPKNLSERVNRKFEEKWFPWLQFLDS
ncbi:uncharacterized protein C8orf76 homolog [Saccoglossus kowalevskii]|uniref:Uncharacterized protein C8orf76 homolog n=1 Tax=Saccoglossus kowalevskii TaxID=10224 RepID=A0ABM0GLQ0_SACKO|nr:PREDICTED: uncharacterized protein C8orf76 homolog [Saccoglossus kowalevskii]